MSKLPDKRDSCVNYRRVKDCRAVESDFECKGKNCPFFATEYARLKAKAKTAARLRTLPAAQQARIANTYYPGMGLWWEDEKYGK